MNIRFGYLRRLDEGLSAALAIEESLSVDVADELVFGPAGAVGGKIFRVQRIILQKS
jgi:hypothetical protein